MKKLLIIVALSFTSCAGFIKFAGIPGPFMTTEGRQCVEGDVNCFDIHQCNFPAAYVVSLSYLIPPSAEMDVIYAFETWNQILGFRAFDFQGFTTQDPENTPNLIIVTTQDYIVPTHEGDYAWARIRWDRKDGCITDSDIFVDKDLFSFGNRDLLRVIMLHEVGHLLGLDHSTDSYDIMRAYIRGPQMRANDPFGEKNPRLNGSMFWGSDCPSTREQRLVREKYRAQN
jgi:hypothetical protein